MRYLRLLTLAGVMTIAVGCSGSQTGPTSTPTIPSTAQSVEGVHVDQDGCNKSYVDAVEPSTKSLGKVTGTLQLLASIVPGCLGVYWTTFTPSNNSQGIFGVTVTIKETQLQYKTYKEADEDPLASATTVGSYAVPKQHVEGCLLADGFSPPQCVTAEAKAE